MENKTRNNNRPAPRPKKLKPSSGSTYIKDYWPHEHIATLALPTQQALKLILDNNSWINVNDVCWCWDGANLFLSLTAIGQGLRLINGEPKNFDSSDFLKKKGWSKLLDCPLPVCSKWCFQLKPDGQNVKPIWYLRLDPGLEELLRYDLPESMNNAKARQLALNAKLCYSPARQEQLEAASLLVGLGDPIKQPEPEPLFIETPIQQVIQGDEATAQINAEFEKLFEPTPMPEPDPTNIATDTEIQKALEEINFTDIDCTPNQLDTFSLWDVTWW